MNTIESVRMAGMTANTSQTKKKGFLRKNFEKVSELALVLVVSASVSSMITFQMAESRVPQGFTLVSNSVVSRDAMIYRDAIKSLVLVQKQRQYAAPLAVIETITQELRSAPDYLSSVPVMKGRGKLVIPPFADLDFMLRLGRFESSFDSNARSDAGAIGIFQVMPRTARRLWSIYGMGDGKSITSSGYRRMKLSDVAERLKDRRVNTRTAILYLSYLYQTYKHVDELIRRWDSRTLVLTAYYHGERIMDSMLARGQLRTWYALGVLGWTA